MCEGRHCLTRLIRDYRRNRCVKPVAIGAATLEPSCRAGNHVPMSHRLEPVVYITDHMDHASFNSSRSQEKQDDLCRLEVHMVTGSRRIQIQAYADGKATDRPFEVSRIPAGSLSEADCLYLLDHFFMANPQHMIQPHARYFELFSRRAPGKNTSREALRRFKEHDLRNLQVWFNLAWVHPLAIERDPELRQLIDKGRRFSEEDKNRLLDKHLALMREIIPLHKKLMESGQVELTTTPFYHPILPLLLDKKLAREAMPDVKLPRFTSGYPDDAATHVRRAIEHHSHVFGKAPVGMWPAEGSVGQSIIPLLAEHGIRWIATDEEILFQSTQGFISRDEHGLVRNPELLYRPYKIKEGERELSIVFRDHALSDLVGFHYQRGPGEDGAEDFLRHLHGIQQALGPKQTPLVSVILDGENCWEHYPDGGVPFLRALYRRCTQTAGIKPVQLGEFLASQPSGDTLPRLFTGSWINHNFAIWIGHEEDNTAWDAIQKTREHLRGRQHLPAQTLSRAWEEIYIAEGSDWFWWYGDDHVSARTTCSTPCFASTCKMSISSWATSRRRSWIGRSAAWAGVLCTRCRNRFSRSRSMAGRRFSNGSAPAAIPVRANAARCRWAVGEPYASSSSASTCRIFCCASISLGRRKSRWLTLTPCE